MSKKRATNAPTAPITDPLKAAILESGIPLLRLAKETGVQRMSISRFLDGRQSIRLDVADALARYFGLKLVKAKSSEPQAKDGTP